MQPDRKQIPSLALFLLPALLLIAVYLLYPAIRTLVGSMFFETTFGKPHWVGLSNFSYLFKNGAFRKATLFTAAFTAVSVALETFLGVILALIMNMKSGKNTSKSPYFLRSVVLLPWVIPSVISARIWQLIYNYDYGFANWLIGALGLQKVNFIGNAASAFFALVVADTWRTTPFVAIIVLAGLQSVPQEVMKQALVDGASLTRRFFKVELPLIAPMITVAVLFRSVDALRVFDLIYIITSGGPGGSTTSLSLLGYRYFTSGDYGLGNASSAVLFVMALAVALLIIKLNRKYG